MVFTNPLIRVESSSEGLIGASLQWKPAGTGWRLFNGRRRMGDVVPDSKYPNMWRIVLHDGRLSDMANLSWARNAVLEAATRELEYEARLRESRQYEDQHPSITRQFEGVFQSTARYSDYSAPRVAREPPGLTIESSAAA